MKPAAAELPDYAPAGDVPRLAPYRASRLTSLAALYTLTVRQHLHGKRWMVMAALFLLPAMLAVLIRAAGSPVPPRALEFVLAFMLIPQALLPLAALVYASGIIQDEQEEQTLTYLLMRPIPRWAIYSMKLFATLTTTVALTTIFTAVTFAAVYVGSDVPFAEMSTRCLKAITVHDAAVAAYCCLFGLISLVTRWPLVVGILYSLLFEGLMANMPFSVRLGTIIYYGRLLAYRWMDFTITPPGMSKGVDEAAAAWQFDVSTGKDLPDHPTALNCWLVLLVGGAACLLIGSLLCSRREFHVKTPEGN